MNNNASSERTRVKRLPKRGVYDRESINAILDEGFVCHVGFVVDGQPYVIPTGYARDADNLIIHGSSASRMLRTIQDGVDVCVTVTLTDGLVVARSAFHHSINYRSVVILGRARLVEDPDASMRAMERLVEHILPGRWDACRHPNDIEMKATTILEIPLAEASAKVRSGPPLDDDEDYALPYWAGVIPFAPQAAAPVPDPKLSAGIEVPAHVRNYARPPKG